MAEDLKCLMDHLSIDSAHVLGWSMGGLIAQEFAAANPNRVKHLLLLGTGLKPDGMLKNFLSNWQNVRHSNLTPEQISRFAMHFVFSHEFADNTQMYDVVAKTMANNPNRPSHQGFDGQVAAIVQYAGNEKLPEFGLPVSVLVAEQDLVAPPYASKRLAEKLSAGKLRSSPLDTQGSSKCPPNTPPRSPKRCRSS